MNTQIINLLTLAKTVLPFLVSIITFGMMLVFYKNFFRKSKNNINMYCVALIATAGSYFAFIDVVDLQRWNYFLDGFGFLISSGLQIIHTQLIYIFNGLSQLQINGWQTVLPVLFYNLYNILVLVRIIKHNKEIYIESCKTHIELFKGSVFALFTKRKENLLTSNFVREINSLIPIYNC